MYRYEMHLHTAPVSKCARASIRESLEFYKEQGYDGVFVTNHYINGAVGKDGRSDCVAVSVYRDILKRKKADGVPSAFFLGIDERHKTCYTIVRIKSPKGRTESI